MSTALAYADGRGRIFFDERAVPLADGGLVREPERTDLLPAPPGTVPVVLPKREPLVARGRSKGRTALAALLPAGFTRLALPAYTVQGGAPALPLFGYSFACAVGERLHVAAMRTDERDDWKPRRFRRGELERLTQTRCASDPTNAVLAQVAVCAREYGCFTAQNVFLARGEAALPVSPRCNARCAGCISELDDDAGIPAPQTRLAYEAQAGQLVRIALAHFEADPHGIVSFGQGCEGEPLLRFATIARALERIRERTAYGTLNLNTNGSLPAALRTLIDAGLDAVRISLNSFRSGPYAAYYRPQGYDLDSVLESVTLAVHAGLRVSLNLLTHPGVTDDEDEMAAMERFLASVPVSMIQTRTLNIDPERYFSLVGRPRRPLGMRFAIDRIQALGVAVGNFTRTH